MMNRISPSLAGCIGAVALLASGCSGERQQSSAADAELIRLSGALTAMQTERDLLQRENHTLRARLERLRLTRAVGGPGCQQPWSPA